MSSEDSDGIDFLDLSMDMNCDVLFHEDASFVQSQAAALQRYQRPRTAHQEDHLLSEEESAALAAALAASAREEELRQERERQRQRERQERAQELLARQLQQEELVHAQALKASDTKAQLRQSEQRWDDSLTHVEQTRQRERHNGIWGCLQCSFENPPYSRICSMCQAQAPPGGLVFVDDRTRSRRPTSMSANSSSTTNTISTMTPRSFDSTGTSRSLTQAEVNVVVAAFTREIVPTTIVCSSPLCHVTHRSFLTLRPCHWLNDEVLHGYLRLIIQREEILRLHRPNAVFPPFFFSRLLNEDHMDPMLRKFNYDGVRNWAEQHCPPDKRLFDLEKLFIPINVGRSHWVALVLDIPNTTFVYLDSMGNTDPDDEIHIKYSDNLRKYLEAEFIATYGEGNPSPRWTEATLPVPIQSNDHDCGVFVCAFADLLLRVSPLPPTTFFPTDAEQYRFHIALSLLQGAVPLA